MFKRDLPFLNDINIYTAYKAVPSTGPGASSSHIPLINAAGSLGFIPNLRNLPDLARFSAFVTNPISRHARRPAESRGMLPFPGGFLLHTGLPNPGFRAALKRFSASWAEAPLPMLIHLIPDDAAEMSFMTRSLEGLENITAIELGLRDDIQRADALGLIRAGLGELPLIICLTPHQAVELGPTLSQSGAAAFSLAPARGCLLGPDGNLVHGRLYGPALLPQAIEAVSALACLGLPVIGSGGVYNVDDITAIHAAGAQVVALDAVLWKNFDLSWTPISGIGRSGRSEAAVRDEG